MRRIRILAISNSGDIIGGGEISFCQMVSRLDRERFEVTVMCPSPGGVWELLGREWEKGVTAEGAEGGRRGHGKEVFEMPGLKGVGLLRLPGRVLKLARLIRRRGYDLVYANGSRCMVYAGLAARMISCPVVWHVRILDEERLDRLLSRLAARIVVNSRAVAGRFGFLNGNSPPVTVVHNGVDLKEFDPQLPGESLRRELGIDARAGVVTILGRLDEWKGHRYFLEAAAQVAACAAQARFLVVGDGVERRRLQGQARRLGLQGRVLFTGNRQDVPQILAASDVLVSASRAEPFGRVLIEAMAMGKPVVATRAGGVPEIVDEGRTGLLVDPASSPQLAQAICRLLQDPDLRRRLGNDGQRRAKKRFSAEQHAREMGRVFGQVGKGSRAKTQRTQ